MLKKILRAILSSLFLTVLSLLLVVVLIVSLASPNYIKKWLSNSGIYSTATDGIIAESQKNQDLQNTSYNDSGPSLNDPAVIEAAKKVLSPQLIQTSTESLINGSFNWLDGKVAKPDFRIDLTQAKNTFATTVGQSVLKRYQSLPVCPPRTAPTTTDPFKINCQLKTGFDINIEVAKFVNTLQTNKDFLPNTVITADSISSYKNDVNTSFYEQNKAIPGYYQLAKKMPIILIAAGLVFAILLIFASPDRLLGVRSIGITLLVWGCIYSVSLLLGAYIVSTQSSKLTKNQTNSAFLTATKGSFETFFKDVNHDSTKIGLEVTGTYVLLGGGLIIGSSILRKKRVGDNEQPQIQEPKT